MDKLLGLKSGIEKIKGELITSRSRQLTYLNQLFDLYKSKDREMDFLGLQVEQQARERDMLSLRRDQAFSQLVDLMAERRQILSGVQDRAEWLKMGIRYNTEERRDSSQTLEEIVEQTVKVWSSKLPFPRASALDAGAKQDAEYKLSQMLREIDIKQKQLVKLLQARDQSE